MLLCGKAPFYGSTDEDIFKAVSAGKFSFERAAFKQVSDEVKHFITQIFTIDYAKRPSAQQCLNHKWMSSHDEKIDEATCLEVLSHLKVFRATETLKMATYTFMASQMVSKSEKEKLASMFRAFDKNGDGNLDKEEIMAGYESQGRIISMEEIDEIFARIDIDQSGFIDYNEFIAASMDMEEMMTTEKLQTAFSKFD